MNPERWQQVKQIFNQAISRGAPERAEFLRRACEGDEDLRREVESLVASHEQAETGFLKGAAIDFSAAAVAAAPPRERPIGPYEIVELIGRGGMGEVYRAFRADGQYSKEVAIKLVRSCVESGGLVERFRNERQILALLEHPNIARLLDGGTTHDGVPYLIMELAEGEPIDQFCESRGLSLSERLQLFRKVCDAVHYAHQRLVIHRDLKPSNIVVTAEGVPKLLDFGIAKLVDPAADGGMTMTRAMTLAYASPEQIRGEALTTATDVYSLGVVLYQMLTGRSPYPGDTSTPHGLARAICELYPIKPSVAASSTAARERPASDERSTSESSPRQRRRRLSGDLDNILLTALRKGPAERYGSVEQFGEDLRRYLDHVPIRARKDTAGYRLSKFIGRHRAGVAATILATLAILGGLGASVYEARSAGRQRARAEQRFRDMRQLARSNIFEFNDAIQNLPGSAAARNLVIQRALGFLEKLGSDEAGDPEVMHEVAAGYERVAALQGSFSGPGIGDTAAALASYKKALAIRESLVAASGGDAEDLNDEYVSLAGYVGTLTRSGRVGEALRTAQQELAVADLLAARQPGDHRSTLARAGALVDVAMAMGGNGSAGSTRQLPEAIANDREAIRLVTPLANGAKDAAATSGLVRWNTFLAYHLRKNRQFGESLDTYKLLWSATKGLQGLPPRLQCNLYNHRSLVFHDLGDFRRATDDDRKALSIVQSMIEADPHDLVAQIQAAVVLGRLGLDQARLGHAADGANKLTSAMETGTRLLAANEYQLYYEGLLLIGHAYQGEILSSMGHDAEAQAQFSEGLALAGKLAQIDSQDFDSRLNIAKLRVAVGVARARQQQYDAAQHDMNDGLLLLTDFLRVRPGDSEAEYISAMTRGNLALLQSCVGGRACAAARSMRLPHLNN